MKTVFVDVDTQLDFVFPAGALSVPGAAVIVENLRELARYAAANGIQVISTADAHTEDDPEFKVWKPHCVAGTTGQQKCAATLLDKRQTLTADVRSVVGAPQIIVEKQKLDCFTNPNLRPLLAALKADRYVVYGVVTEYCVQCAAVGLAETGAKVEIVGDAVMSLDTGAAQQVLDKFPQKTTADIVRSHL